jgi:uncharacterized protein (TIRG00374 family)
MTKRTAANALKYLLALGLLASVIWTNWAPANRKAEAALAAGTAGMAGSPLGPGPLAAAAAAVPGRADPKGLGYVWDRHVVHGQPIHAGFLLAAFLLYAAAMSITLLRWFLLVRALDLPLRLREALRLGMIGVFFNTLLPGSVGGDIIKAAALARGQSRRTAAVATVIMDRVIALWALVWFVAILGSAFWLAGALEGQAKAASTFIVSVAVVTVVVSVTAWLLLGLLPDARAERFAGRLERLPKVGVSAAEFWRSVWMYRCRQKSVAAVLALSWVGHVGFVVAFYCGAHVLWSPELGPVPTLAQHFLLVPIGLVVQALVPTPGGAGGGEWGFGALYVLFKAAEANGVLGSLVQRAMSWVLGLLGFAVFMRMRAGLPTAASEPEPPAESLPVVAALAAESNPS